MKVPEAVQKLIRESGNTFHAKVARWFTDDGWKVSISPYFMDQTQNKAREIDLVAEKSWPVRDITNRLMGDVVVRLFIECKFIAGNSVFWFADKDEALAMKMVAKLRGGFRPDNTYTKKHHYLSDSSRVAKLFATEKSVEQDPFYKALNQALNALTAMRNQPPSILESSRRKTVTLNYPLIVCNSLEGAFGTDFYGEGEPVKIQDNFQMEVQYAFTDNEGSMRNEYFLIDVVSFERLNDISKALERDAGVAIHFMEPT